MKPENKQRLELRQGIQVACAEAYGQWTGCDWATEHGKCRVDLDGLTSQDAESRAKRYAAVADGERPSDPEIRELRLARQRLDSNEELSQPEVAALLAADYSTAAPWLREVEADAARAQTLATGASIMITYAWIRRDDASYLKAREMAGELAAIQEKYATHLETWNRFTDVLNQYLEPEPFGGR